MPRRFARRLRPSRILLGLLAVTAFAACESEVRRGDGDLQIRLILDPTPTPPGPTTIRLDVSDVDWSPENGARVTLTATLEGGPSATATARGEGAGTYTAQDVPLTAEGVWLLTTRVETLDGRWTEVDHRVTVGGAAGA